MKPNKHNPVVRAFVIAGARVYAELQRSMEGLARRFRFSLSFKIGIRYLRWLFATIFTSTLLIIGAICFVFVWEDMRGVEPILTKVSQQVSQSGRLDEEMLRLDSRSEGLSFVLIEPYGRVIQSAGEFPVNYFLNAEDWKKRIYVSVVNKSVFMFNHKDLNYSGSSFQLIVLKNMDGRIRFVLYFSIITLAAQILAMLRTFFKMLRSNRDLLRPIENMTKTTKKISASNLNLRINIQGTQDELKELAETINEMMDRIETSYLHQQQFVSDASHELRTPIAVIQGYANLLERWGKEEPQVLAESISAIKNEAENMNELVEKLLFLARNDRKNLLMQKENFDLSAVLQELVKETRLIDTKHEISSSIPEKVLIEGDKSRIKQALRIFIDNAVKYTPEKGKIEIKAVVNEGEVVVRVKDTGIGIGADDLKNIFERFYRSDKSRSKKTGGHGLGLAIAKIIILAHGGKINVRSKEEEGTEFNIVFTKQISKE